jgi:hypothetical protein
MCGFTNVRMPYMHLIRTSIAHQLIFKQNINETNTQPVYPA